MTKYTFPTFNRIYQSHMIFKRAYRYKNIKLLIKLMEKDGCIILTRNETINYFRKTKNINIKKIFKQYYLKHFYK